MTPDRSAQDPVPVGRWQDGRCPGGVEALGDVEHYVEPLPVRWRCSCGALIRATNGTTADRQRPRRAALQRLAAIARSGRRGGRLLVAPSEGGHARAAIVAPALA